MIIFIYYAFIIVDKRRDMKRGGGVTVTAVVLWSLDGDVQFNGYGSTES